MQFQGDTGPYLAPAAGAASLDLLKMLREGLFAGVRDAIKRAEEQGAPVRVGDLRVRSHEGFRELAVEVVPIKREVGKSGGFIVLFDESHSNPEPRRKDLRAWWRGITGNTGAPPADGRDTEILHLTRELAEVRYALQAAREEHETVNEELQSVNEEAQCGNEELQSINEELEGSKEEIQASNEELATINDELQARNAALLGSRDYSASIVDSVPVPLLVLDTALRVSSANRAFCEHFDVALAETEGKLIYNLGNRQWDIPELRRLLEEVLPEQNSIAGFEVRHTFESIGPRIVLVHARQLTRGTGPSTTQMILWLEDITEQRQAEAALRQNLFSTLIEQAPGAVFTLDGELRFCHLNPKARAVFGNTEPLIGRRYGDVMDILWGDKLAEQIVAVFRHTLATGEHHASSKFYERRADTGDEESYEWEVQRMSLPGGALGLVCYFTDVTKIRRDAVTLRESEARKDAILTSALDAIITMDHKGRLVEFNPAAERIFGHAREDVLGRSLAEVIIPERLRERHGEGLKNYLATGEGPVLHQQIEQPALRADGTEFPAELAIIPIPGIHPPIFTAFLRDVTGRKQLEDSLVARAGQLAQADRSKDEFLAMLAHELRTPSPRCATRRRF